MLKQLWTGIGAAIRLVSGAACLFIIYLLIFKLSLIHVRGPSMQPTMCTGDLCIIYETQSVERGDVITISVNDSFDIIKRVVGLPGERLFISKHGVMLLGKNNKYDVDLVFNIVGFDGQKFVYQDSITNAQVLGATA